MDKVQTGKLHSGDASIATRVIVRQSLDTVDGLVTKKLNEHSHLQEERNVQIAKVYLRSSRNALQTLTICPHQQILYPIRQRDS